MMAAAIGARKAVTEEDRTRRLMRFVNRRVDGNQADHGRCDAGGSQARGELDDRGGVRGPIGLA